jgi:hypothetical protein
MRVLYLVGGLVTLPAVLVPVLSTLLSNYVEDVLVDPKRRVNSVEDFTK